MVRVVWASSALAVSIACAVQEQGAPVGTGRALESGGMDDHRRGRDERVHDHDR
jgi:hypothetical protein